jgi:hypothetical protein
VSDVRFVVAAVDMLQRAGHPVSPADGVPGLWNVEGIANDLTTAQLLEVAGKHGLFGGMMMPAFTLATFP